MDGATDFNSVGVKNYRSLDQGLDASRDTLQGGADSYGYAAILQAAAGLRLRGDDREAINASAWCRGCTGGAYITGLLPIVRPTTPTRAAHLARGAALVRVANAAPWTLALCHRSPDLPR